jgi:phosphatidylserine/phosphatidylglycerophosphate/cardiolipin synthase-like enzyme
MEGYAEEYAQPSYKWIGQRRYVTNIKNWAISNFPGGIGFSLFNYEDGKALKVILKIFREDGACERYILDTYYCGEFGDNWQKWQTHKLPLFPYESCHGCVTFIKFSYVIHKNGKSVPSYYDYKFAGKHEFDQGWIYSDDFHDTFFKTENDYVAYEFDQQEVQRAYDRINAPTLNMPTIYPIFTRGDVHSVYHPVNEIHTHIDWTIEQNKDNPDKRHSIVMAVFDFDNEHIANHLIYAHSQGIEVECIGDWAAVGSMNCSESIAKMRRAGIHIYGVVRNTPGDPNQGIASMHTKIVLFDNEIVHSSSYNFHFHLWGGNWENALVYQSKDFSTLYRNIYNAIRGGVGKPVQLKTENRFNLFYTFAAYSIPQRHYYRAQDAIITEINNAKYSILIVMFDIGEFSGVSSHDHHETNVIDALFNAKNRGVNVKIVLNGMITHTGDLPGAKDIDAWRPLKHTVQRLKDGGFDIDFIFYWESIYSPIHHKYAVIDNETIITESFNWYVTSLYSDEVLSVIRDKKLADRFIDETYKIWEKFRITKH